MITGRGAHVAILDDPIKAGDASPEAARNAGYDWFKVALMSRFDKPAEARIVVIAQRLHQDDLIGRLRNEGGWTALEMPGEAWREQVFELGDGEHWIFKPGDLLFPERFGRDALQQLSLDLGEAAFSAQIQQRPIPAGGALLKLKHFRRYEILPPRSHIGRVIQSWDPAFVDGDLNAYTVCTSWVISGQKLYLFDVFPRRLEFPELAPAILEQKRGIGPIRSSWRLPASARPSSKHSSLCSAMGAGSIAPTRSSARPNGLWCRHQRSKGASCSSRLAGNLRGRSARLSQWPLCRSGRLHGPVPLRTGPSPDLPRVERLSGYRGCMH